VARILVIDDDRAIRAVVLLLLERCGHQAVAAESGKQALGILDSGDFDLLIIDIFMPEMDGFETIRSVRSSKPNMPIIVMSGAHNRPGPIPDFLLMATKLGAIESLRKPFTPQVLIAIVESCLGQSSEDRGRSSRPA
jgi:CheY-like chemotaxis protein